MTQTTSYDPLGDNISEVQLVQVVGSDAMVAAAARVSYANDTPKTPEQDEKLIRFLLAKSHGSPLEHNLLTFRLKMPLYIVQELLRHRVGTSVNQQSHRYLQLGEKVELEFYVPRVFRGQSVSNRQASAGTLPDQIKVAGDDGWGVTDIRSIYSRSLLLAGLAYQKLIDNGVAREIARGVLPHCTYTSLYWTCNLRSLLHFLGLRDSPDAQWEIMKYAQAMRELAVEHFPITMRVQGELDAD